MMNKLNLGSSNPRGQYLNGEWINVDLFKCDNLDVQANILSLPFRDNTFEIIHSVHVAEHLTRDKHVPMFKEAYRVLAPGGSFFVEVPNGKDIVYLLADAFTSDDRVAIHKWKTSVHGKTDRKGMAHYYLFDEFDLKERLQSAGFSKIERLINKTVMISNHYKMEPVLLFRCNK